MLAVVVADVATEGDYEFERRQLANPDQLRRLADWLAAQNVPEVVMESTAQYWRPLWKHWNEIGARSAGTRKVLVRCPDRCCWRLPNPIMVHVGESGI
jgi:hypothetical protein